MNVGTIDILLKNENASSTAGNRFALPNGSFILGPNKSIEFAYDVASSRWRPTTLPDMRNRVVLPADVINNNAVANTLADVTGLQFSVVAGQKYRFKFAIAFIAAATTTGSRWVVNGPTLTGLALWSRYTLGATSDTVNSVAAYNSPAASNLFSASSGCNAFLEGIIEVSAAGNVVARFASEVASSSITAQGLWSYVEYEPVGN